MEETRATPAPERRARRWPVTWQVILITLILVEFAAVATLMIFQEPETVTIAVSAYVCGLTTLAIGVGVLLARQVWKPLRLPGCLGGLVFIIVGSLGAVYAETVYWGFEKVFGAQGVAADPNLIVDLLVTMPWYFAMVTALWLVQRRFRYHWTTVALLGALYEAAGDGIVGHIVGGNAITLEYLFLLLVFFPGIFMVTYAPMVVVPVWLFPMDDKRYTGPRWLKIVGGFLPLLPLIPYGAIVILLFRPS
jgi:hypothetical protein